MLGEYREGLRGFVSKPFPSRMPAFSDYDHLARFAEWSDEGAEEAEADVSALPADLDTRRVSATPRIPSVSAWVSANAGAGKTTVLRNRVLRLLLGGADPGRVLCLTFTKAAAAEMSNRVFAELSRWVGLDDDGARRAIADIAGEAPSVGCARAGAPPFRARRRDPRRLARRHHSRLLHAPAAGLRLRGQCAGALHGARGAAGRAS